MQSIGTAVSREINSIIGIIGCGTMGSAILKSCCMYLQDRVRVTCSDIDSCTRGRLQRYMDVQVVAENTEVAADADLVVLAVQPKFMADICRELKPVLKTNTTILSIAAGFPISEIKKQSGIASVIRAMPNQACTIGEGVTLLTGPAQASDPIHMLARDIFSCMGIVEETQCEHEIDIATALSGSGPAYILTFIDAMVSAAVELGMTRDVATNLVTHTITGTCNHLQVDMRCPLTLLNGVVTPGGTTAAALAAAEKTGFRSSIREIVQAAHNRCNELNGLADQQ